MTKFPAMVLGLALSSCGHRLPETQRQPPEGAAISRSIKTFAVNDLQGSAKMYEDIYSQLTSENCRIEIILEKQIALVFAGDELAIRTPISTGESAFPTLKGAFTILQKKEYHESTLYGSYVKIEDGTTVLQDANSRTQTAPPGTKWKGSPVPYWQRLTWSGIGMHVGKLPGHPASHGCIRYPAAVMPYIYAKTKIGTNVSVE